MQNSKYVLITGAGEGLGKSLAIEFARRGGI
jgi:NAD(P)-dependent dehydrogenase (short-subunit alcohol dehydrogenase family)